MKLNHIYCGDSVRILKELPSDSIDCCVTSPPYYALRDYGVCNQIGVENTLGEYIDKLLCVFSEVHRVLKKDGTFWLNLGDTYSYSSRDSNAHKTRSLLQRTNIGSLSMPNHEGIDLKSSNLKPKDLMGIPWTIALDLRNKLGFYLRQDIIWAKPNPMPESVKDRCTKSHEYIFLLSKSKKYYFNADAIKEKADEKSIIRYNSRFNTGVKEISGAGRLKQGSNTAGFKKFTGYKNKRDVWIVATRGYKGAHFATFPTALIKPCILAGCREGGIVLDPFFGSGTVGVVAKELNRNYIGIDINGDYCNLAENRINGGNKNA